MNAIKDYENVCQRIFEAIRLIANEKLEIKFYAYSIWPKTKDGYIINGIHVNDYGKIVLDLDEDYYLKNGWGEVICTMDTLPIKEQYIMLNCMLNC